MAEILIKNLCKSYGRLEVLHDIGLAIREGEFVVLVGPSGCGKSTLLRIIAGLEDFSRGDLVIGDRSMKKVPPQKRDISMVFQSYALFPHMNVKDNMAFGSRVRKEAESAIERRIEAVAEKLNLGAYLDRFPRQLSGGQRQRVAMGRSIMHSPNVHLFDEPLSNLDARLRVQMRAEIKRLHAELQTTTVYVTHDQVEAMTMADRIVVMNGGYIEQVGSPLELYDRPKNTFVAGFIGSPSMNLLSAQFERGDGCAVVFADGRKIAVRDMPADTGQPVIIGCRPEHFSISPQRQGIEMKVNLVEHLGSTMLIHGEACGQLLAVEFRDRLPVKAGEKINLMPDMSRIHIFGAQGGNLGL